MASIVISFSYSSTLYIMMFDHYTKRSRHHRDRFDYTHSQINEREEEPRTISDLEQVTAAVSDSLSKIVHEVVLSSNLFFGHHDV